MPDLGAPVARILERRATVPTSESMLVAVSGIDASGKGYTTRLLVEALRETGLNAIGINIDGWLNLPGIRYSQVDPGGHFYRNAIRFDEMFELLVMPLKKQRSITLDADLTEELATAHHRHRYEFSNVDIIVLEGVFLFKKEYQNNYDLKIWVECSFELAMRRAITRCQEGLPPDETVKAFETIYFPAQYTHFDRDDPKSAADMIVMNVEQSA